MTKEHRLVIKIDEADLAWLSDQEEEFGIDKVSIVRMMIRRHRRAGVPAMQSVAPARQAHHDNYTIPSFLGADISPTEGQTEEYSEDTISDAEIEDIVSARLSEAKEPPAPIVSAEYGQSIVRPLHRNKKPSGKGWMRA